jgi:hypothetical protein
MGGESLMKTLVLACYRVGNHDQPVGLFSTPEEAQEALRTVVIEGETVGVAGTVTPVAVYGSLEEYLATLPTATPETTTEAIEETKSDE